MHYLTAYPDVAAARDRFVIDLRGARSAHDPWQLQDLAIEDEPDERGGRSRVGTVFLTGRECPWRCAMCDLWRYTTRDDTPPGAVPAQIEAARRAWASGGESVAKIKLYNASNFFDPRAVPENDYAAIGALVHDVEQVIVESHPSLIGDRVDRFLRALDGPRLEVAMGLETAHPAALDALNKRMTIADFTRAAEALRHRNVSLRVFLLISPPFIPDSDQDEWLLKSVEFAEACGASVISLIPARAGNGAMEALTAQKLFRPPTQEDVDRSLKLVLARAPSRALRQAQGGPEQRRGTEPRAPRILLDPWAHAG